MPINNVGELLEGLYRTKGKRKGIIYIDDTATIQEAAAMMTEAKVKFLGVTRKTRGGRLRKVGVISNTDTTVEFGTSIRPSERLIYDLPKRPVVTVKMGDSIDYAVQVLTEAKVGHVVVVDRSNHWRAVLSQDEAVQALIDNLTEEDHFHAVRDAEFHRT